MYFYLLGAGLIASSAHFYLVWHHRDDRRYSISEHAMLTPQSCIFYLVSHVLVEILYLLFSYQFFIVKHPLYLAFYLNAVFVLLDFVQAALPSRGKTKKIHFTAAYVSWCCYLASGILAFVKLPIAQPYAAGAIIVILPVLGMFFYMHINRSKLYPYQLAMVPMFILYMLLIVMGAH